jgi:hypothetical protein
MDIVEVGIDAGMMQRFPPTSEVLLGGTYESRIVAIAFGHKQGLCLAVCIRQRTILILAFVDTAFVAATAFPKLTK